MRKPLNTWIRRAVVVPLTALTLCLTSTVQAQTVTSITAAVDETALAAETTARTMALIHVDTEAVAQQIDQLEGGLKAADARLSNLSRAAGEFITLIRA